MPFFLRRSSLRAFPRRAICVSANAWLLVATALAVEPPLPRWQPAHPVRELELLTGERLLVENVRCDAEGIDIDWLGQTHVRLPLALVRAVASPSGWVDHVDESFESLPVVDNDTSGAHSGRRSWRSSRDPLWMFNAGKPLASGELSLWWRCDPNAHTIPANSVLLTLSPDEPASALQIRLNHDGTLTTPVPSGWQRTFSQMLKPANGWTRLAITWREQRCEVQLDDALHTIFEKAPGLHRFTLQPVGDATGTIIVDDLVLREFDATLAARAPCMRMTEDQDCLTLITGDQLFGRLSGVENTRSITLRSDQATWTGDWTELVRIDFARRPLPADCLAPVTGWHAALRRGPRGSAGTPFTTLRNVHMEPNLLHHPWLGAIALPPLQAVLVDDMHYGEFRWLEPDRRHLGDEIRGDLSPMVPVGTTISGSITLTERPRGVTAIVLDAAELEPSGPQTIPTQPFLDVLRGGGLRTELLINDRIITDLNRSLTVRVPARHPVRLTIPVPPAAWRVGQNTWAIRQRPLSSSNLQFDDAEVGRIGLWVSPF